MVNDEPSNPGELREDIPLRPSESTGFAHKFGGVKLIIISFALLSLAVTIALATQIHYGDYEVVPHGSVATDSQECSSIGTNVLKFGGNAVDAAIAAAFCLSVVNPHSAGLDATGTMMMYDYRKSRRTPITPSPIVVDFTADSKSNIPQLVKGLAFIHNRFGSIDWEELVLPAAELARTGFSVPNTLVMALQNVGNVNLFGPIQPGHILKLPSLASFLYAIANSSVTSFIPEASVSGISTSEAANSTFNGTTIYMPAKPAAIKLMKFLNYSNAQTEANFQGADAVRTATNIKMIFPSSSSGSSSTVAVIDKDELYVSLIIGLNSPLGSQIFATGGFILDDLPQRKPNYLNNFMPIIITPEQTCGQRIVLSCGEVTGAAQVIENLLKGKATSEQLASVLESPRLQTLNGSIIAYEKSHTPIFNDNILETLRLLGTVVVAPEPYPTCNGIQQLGDDLISHSDSRGGGIASRF